jgi:hypothetical protein
MVLEINVASICASVPIFWPVIRPFLGAIFVTREFSVKHELREQEDQMEHDRTGSETELNAHYKDSFVQDLVDPFSSKDGGLVQSQIKSENSGKKTRPWRWF